MPFQGLPGDEDIARLTYKRRFVEAYGQDADVQSLYIAQPGTWTRFAPMFPHVAFLLESLMRIHHGTMAMQYALEDAYAHVNNRELSYLTRTASSRFRENDPFAYYVPEVEDEQRRFLGHLRLMLQENIDITYKKSNNSTASLIPTREYAEDLVDVAKEEERAAIVEELISPQTAAALTTVEVNPLTSIWTIRRQVLARDAMIEHNILRIKELLQELKSSTSRKRSVHLDDTTNDEVEKANDEADLVEYGAKPIARFPRFAATPYPERSPSPSQSQSHSHTHPRSQRGRRNDNHQHRSISRDSIQSSTFGGPASSITTWAPEEPDHFTLSMKVWSTTKDNWVESLAVMDTGCEGGNFVSSAFLEAHLDMVESMQPDPDADKMQLVDFGGKTDFKPTGKVLLKWYGRNIQSGHGRRGKRSITAESWFRVAPHLPSFDGDDDEQPFQILLGKDWLHENEVFTYRGLRLCRSKDKKSQDTIRKEQAEHDRRHALRQQAELERMRERSSTSGSTPDNSGSSMTSSSMLDADSSFVTINAHRHGHGRRDSDHGPTGQESRVVEAVANPPASFSPRSSGLSIRTATTDTTSSSMIGVGGR